MSVKNTIDVLKQNLPSYVITNQSDGCDHLLKAKRAIFLDTGFATRLSLINFSSLGQLLDIILEQFDAREIVVIVTELVLFELKDANNNEINCSVKQIFDLCKEKEVPVVVINEETLYKELMRFSDYNIEWWNILFLERLKENKANLIKLMKLIDSDTSLSLNSTFEVKATTLRDKEFVASCIEQFKERKHNRDSLAEELISVIIMFLFEGFMNTPNKRIYFCSCDNGALARIKMTLSTSYRNDMSSFENIHLFTLIQFMVTQGILSDKAEVKNIFEKMMQPTIAVVEKKDLPFCETEQKITIDQVIDGIFNGREYSYRGNYF